METDTHLPGDSLRSRLDQVLRGSALPATLGIRLVGWGPGWARLAVTPTQRLTGLAARPGPGVLAALADSGLEVASNSYGRVCAAISLSGHVAVEQLGDAALETLAREVTRDARTACYEITTRQEGRVVALHTGVVARTGGWHLGEDAWPPAWRADH